MAAKTRQTVASVSEFLGSIDDPRKRADCRIIAGIMRAATGKRAKMWGSSMVGYGSYDYCYASGRTGTSFLTGFSPRARNIAIYIMPGFGRFESLMDKLGTCKTGKSCLYIRKLDDVDVDVLESLIRKSVLYMRENYVTH